MVLLVLFRTASKFFSNFFNLLTLALLFYVLYVILIRPLLSYFSRNMPLASGSTRPGNPPGGPPGRPWFGGLGGWGPGGGGGGSGGPSGGSGRPGDVPPPYSAKDDTTAGTSSSMWADVGRDLRRGATMGVGSTIAEIGINSLLGRNRGREPPQQRYATAPPFMQPQAGFARGGSPFAARDNYDRGEGGSGTTGLGSMRTSSGFGGTRNR